MSHPNIKEYPVPRKVKFFSVDELIPLSPDEEMIEKGLTLDFFKNLDLKVSKGYFTTRKAANKRLKQVQKNNPGMKLAVTTLVCDE